MAEVKEKEKEESNSSTDHDHLLIDTLPKEKDWVINGTAGLCLYKGFWCSPMFLTRVMSFNHHYKAEPSDILLATLPKCGTTWLKALTFSITNRHLCPLSDSPLLRSNPHAVVRSFENYLNSNDVISFLENLPRPRLISTHIPYHALPPSVTTSGCKIVCILRDPRDQFVSFWHFMDKLLPGSTVRPFEECFDLFCRGVHEFGPFWDHILGSFDACKDRPDKILILRYEEMKVSPVDQTRKLACFLGFPFSEEEEKGGVVEEIVKLCSFDHLKGLKVNKEGKSPINGVPHNSFFRKGEVGDWSNYLTPPMNDRIRKLMNDKFGSSLFDI